MMFYYIKCCYLHLSHLFIVLSHGNNWMPSLFMSILIENVRLIITPPKFYNVGSNCRTVHQREVKVSLKTRCCISPQRSADGYEWLHAHLVPFEAWCIALVLLASHVHVEGDPHYLYMDIGTRRTRKTKGQELLGREGEVLPKTLLVMKMKCGRESRLASLFFRSNNQSDGEGNGSQVLRSLLLLPHDFITFLQFKSRIYFFFFFCK